MHAHVDRKFLNKRLPAVLASMVALSLIISGTASSQEPSEDIEASLDVLMAPRSPGFVLLGVEPAAVERPGTVTDLGLMFLNSSQNLSQLPANFSLEIAPYWLASGQNISYEEYANPENVFSGFLQTLSISLAASPGSDVQSDSLGRSWAIGVNFSFLNGRIDPEFNNYANKLDTLYMKQGEINTEVADRNRDRKLTDPLLRELKDSLITIGVDTSMPETQKDSLIAQIQARMGQRNEDIESEIEAEVRQQMKTSIDSVQSIATSLRFRRLGWKWDMAGGLSSNFSGNDFESGHIGTWGIWATFGHEWKKESLLGVVRYLGEGDQSDSSSIDLGGRVIYDNATKFSISVEAVSRTYLGSENEDTQWRLALLLDYAFAKNRAISFTFGRNFSGQRSGNLISLASIIFGFGSDRPL
jgi:hypothetical protein